MIGGPNEYSIFIGLHQEEVHPIWYWLKMTSTLGTIYWKNYALLVDHKKWEL